MVACLLLAGVVAGVLWGWRQHPAATLTFGSAFVTVVAYGAWNLRPSARADRNKLTAIAAGVAAVFLVWLSYVLAWNSDGTFDEVRVEEVARPDGSPAGQAAPAGADDVVGARLAELGDYVLEPVEAEHFTETVNGVTFGWELGKYDDGTYYINVVPGDFIAYYEPWDGLEYDT